MKISRTGASANHGTSSILLKSPHFSFGENGEILVKQNRVADFNTDSRHNYVMALSLAEVQEMLRTLAAAALANQKFFENSMGESLKPILQLPAVLSGIAAAQLE